MRMKISPNKLLMYAVAISLMMNSSWMVYLMEPFVSVWKIQNVQYILLAIFCLAGCFYHNRFSIGHKPMLVLAMLVAYLLFYLVVTRENPLSYLLKHVVIFVILYLYCCVLLKNGQIMDFAKVFVNVVSVVAAISLFFWLFGSVLGVVNGIPSTYQWGKKHWPTVNYFWLYFENIVQAQVISGQTVIRNTGIYAESPGFSGFLIMALAIVLPAEKGEFSAGQKLLLLVTMMTTLSTKGILAVIMLALLTYLFRKPAKTRSAFLIKSVFAAIIVITGILLSIVILREKSTTGSYMQRMDDFLAALQTWKAHMLFGTGYRETDEIIGNFSWRGRSNNGLSMGLTVLMAQGGLHMLTFYIASFAAALFTARRAGRAIFVRVMIFGIMIGFNLVISTAQYDPTTLLILSCGYAYCATIVVSQSARRDIQQASDDCDIGILRAT